MVHTNDFRTRSVISDTANTAVPNTWPIAIDVGYSIRYKGFSPNKIIRNPIIRQKPWAQNPVPVRDAKNMGQNPVLYGELDPDEILYKDGETGEVWRVGRNAQQMISERDTGIPKLMFLAATGIFHRCLKY